VRIGVRKKQRNWLVVEWFSVRRREPSSNSIEIPTRSFVGMTELGVFGITVLSQTIIQRVERREKQRGQVRFRDKISTRSFVGLTAFDVS